MTTKSGRVKVYSGEIRNVAYDVSRALRDHNEMVERIAYLEKVVADIAHGVTPKVNVEKVTFSSGGGYGGKSVKVIAGHGEPPKSFTAVGDSGVKIKATKTLRMCGGGHGEGAAYPCEDWDITMLDGARRYFDHYGEIFTLVE